MEGKKGCERKRKGRRRGGGGEQSLGSIMCGRNLLSTYQDRHSTNDFVSIDGLHVINELFTFFTTTSLYSADRVCFKKISCILKILKVLILCSQPSSLSYKTLYLSKRGLQKKRNPYVVNFKKMLVFLTVPKTRFMNLLC